jgi:hypothetical protein
MPTRSAPNTTYAPLPRAPRLTSSSLSPSGTKHARCRRFRKWSATGPFGHPGVAALTNSPNQKPHPGPPEHLLYRTTLKKEHERTNFGAALLVASQLITLTHWQVY